MKTTRVLAFCLGLLLLPHTSRSAVLYTYDFPGSPGSGLASAQTNPQPPKATFSDFTRAASLAATTSASGNNVFSSNGWGTGAAFDPAQYVGYSIAAATGFVLNLTSIDFLAGRSATGPTSARASLFLNGVATPYASLDFTPATSLGAFTLNFPALTSASNVSSAEIRFYGWSGGGGRLDFDDVATNGATAVATVPEASAIVPVLLLLAAITGAEVRRHRRGALRLTSG